MLIDKEQVKAFLPHREPFLFIDTVESISGPSSTEGPVKYVKDLEGVEVKTKYHIGADHPVFEGHFPGNPILPGVIQVEMMGQTAGFTIAKLYPWPFKDINLKMALLKVENAKFRKPITPDMELDIVSTCRKFRKQMSTYDCKIYHKGTLMSEASILASFED
jgi:3-hydroxyacyl-[acyl-carrier-protein] dehydratase